MRNSIYLILILSSVFLSSCSLFNKGLKMDTYIEMKTSEGDIIVGLYEKTPIHSNHFKQVCESNTYDSLLIHQIGPDGIIIAGDTASKNVDVNYLFNSTAIDTSLKPEIYPEIIHTRAKIGAWRVDDENNPEKYSHPTVFYMIYGVNYSEKNLKLIETIMNKDIIQEYMDKYLEKDENKHLKDSLDYYKIQRMNKDFENLFVKIRDRVIPIIKSDGKNIFKFSDYQKTVYSENPGIPYLDGKYTIFGEVVYGEDILEKLTKKRTRIKYRPQRDILILSTKVLTDEEWKEIKKSIEKQRKN